MKKLIDSIFFIALCSCMALVSCISDGDDSDTGSIELVAGDKLPVFGVTMNDGTVYHLFAKSGIPRIYIVDAELTIRKVFTDNPLAGYDELVAAINDASLR